MIDKYNNYLIKRIELLKKHTTRMMLNESQETDEHLAIRYRGEELLCFASKGKDDRYLNETSEEIKFLGANLIADRMNNIIENHINSLDQVLPQASKFINKFKKQWKTKTLNKLLYNIDKHGKDAIELAIADENPPRTERIMNPFEWAEQHSYKNTYRQQDFRYRTNQGKLVRTKSEVLWANCLDKHGIPYAYEPQLVIEGRVLFPDFMPIKPDGSLIIIEHCGLMDDESYRKHWYQKMDKYRTAGYYPNRNLLITTEEDLMVEGRLDELLLRFYYL